MRTSTNSQEFYVWELTSMLILMSEKRIVHASKLIDTNEIFIFIRLLHCFYLKNVFWFKNFFRNQVDNWHAHTHTKASRQTTNERVVEIRCTQIFCKKTFWITCHHWIWQHHSFSHTFHSTTLITHHWWLKHNHCWMFYPSQIQIFRFQKNIRKIDSVKSTFIFIWFDKQLFVLKNTV